MKAIGYQESLAIDSPNALLDIELPTPVATGKDILVRVAAVSVNPVDTKIRTRAQPAEGEYKVLGWDAAGVVESVGEDVTMFKAGDKVWYAGAIDRSGTNAEYHLVDERIVSKMPSNSSFIQAAAMPLTSITAWELLFDRLKLDASSTGELLIIGASGGVGSIITQLAKKLTKLTVIGTASRPETKQWVEDMGADHVVDHSKPLNEELKAIGFDTIPYIISLTQTDQHLPSIIEMIAPQGKFALIDDPTSLDVMPFKVKSVSIHWELMFTRSLFQTDDMLEQHKLLKKVAAMVEMGALETTVALDLGTINAENLIKAHTLLESGKSVGKIVLAGF
jgi:zinc-binding alcohol dehydrogenase family protein